MRVSVSCKSGNSLQRKFDRINSKISKDILDKYGVRGVRMLRDATPKDTGETASSWTYDVIESKRGYELQFNNTHINKGVNIAIILQYGHGTGTGVYIEGRDYINPAIEGVVKELAREVKEKIKS